MKEFRWSTLHVITRLIVVAAVLRLSADTLDSVRTLSKVRLGEATWMDWLVSTAHAYGYSLIFFGTAATVELLFRIWREFRELRAIGIDVVDRASATAPAKPPAPAESA